MGTRSGNYNYDVHTDIRPNSNQGITIFDLNIGTTYYFVITAVDESGYESGFSNEAFAMVQEFNAFTPPTIPVNLKVESIHYGTILKLTWGPSTDDDDIRSYVVYRKTNNAAGRIRGSSSQPMTRRK